MLDKIQLPTNVSFKPDEKNKWKAKLVLEPLHPGYGVTLGNALRRTLLSSLPGASITAVKLKGAEHEFSTLDGVKEDVIAIILNLKKVRVKSHGDEPVKLNLNKTGEGSITAGDFDKSSEVEVVNPDQVIATSTSKDTKFEMEVTIEKGRGYVPVEDREKEQLEIGTISIDSIYTPVRNVSLDVSSARVGQITNFDKLTMAIETDGTLTPKEAVERAASLISDHVNLFIKDMQVVSDTEKRSSILETAAETGSNALMGTSATGVGDGQIGTADPATSNLEMSVEELDLSTRTLNALYNNDVKKVKDIVKMTEQELADLQGLGGKALAEITKALKKVNVSFSGGMGGTSKPDVEEDEA